jgi:hypothetical protein
MSVHAATVALRPCLDPSPSAKKKTSQQLGYFSTVFPLFPFSMKSTGKDPSISRSSGRARARKHQHSYREREALGNSDGFGPYGWMG